MRKITVLLLWGCLLTISFGCKRACKDVTCLNGGSCDNGNCNCKFGYGGLYCDSLCPQGYGGVFCNTEIRQQFIRTWSATITRIPGGTTHVPLSITAGTSISYVNVNNFNGEGFNFVGINATSNSFSLSSQAATGSYTGTVSGSGVLNGTNLLINLTRQDGVTYIANCNP